MTENTNESGLILQPNRERAVAPTAGASTPADLIRVAIAQGAGLETIERLLAMQERLQAAQAKAAFDVAFARFKSEAIDILKRTAVTDGPLKGKRYAELSNVVEAVTPALSKHGLSSSWKVTKDEKDWIEVTCYLKHAEGHVESVSMGGPPDTGGAKNAIQARASTVSYLERYTLKAITGTAEKGDDKDGAAVVDLAALSPEDQAALEALQAVAFEGEAALQAAFQTSPITETAWNLVRDSLIDCAKKADREKPKAKPAAKRPAK